MPVTSSWRRRLGCHACVPEHQKGRHPENRTLPGQILGRKPERLGLIRFPEPDDAITDRRPHKVGAAFRTVALVTPRSPAPACQRDSCEAMVARLFPASASVTSNAGPSRGTHHAAGNRRA